jgi:hypothetical protein
MVAARRCRMKTVTVNISFLQHSISNTFLVCFQVLDNNSCYITGQQHDLFNIVYCWLRPLSRTERRLSRQLSRLRRLKKSHVAIKYLGDCVITGQMSIPPVQNFEYHGRESTPRERVKLDTRRPRDSRRSNTGRKRPKA